MPLPDTTLALLEAGDLDALEDEWLTRVDTDPTDIDYFVAVAKAAPDIETFKPLLRLVDEELESRHAQEERLQLLLEAGNLFLRPGPLHEAVVSTLEALYSESPSLGEMQRIAGLHRPSNDSRRLAQQVANLRALMMLDVGSLVHMEGKGVGRIVDINFELASYKVDLEKHEGLMVGFRAGAKMLQPIPPDHVLRTKIEDPDRLRELAKQEPSELLRLVLESYDRPLTAAEIKATLDGIVTPGSWARWWASARSHSQVIVTPEKRQRYRWAETTQHATESLLADFDAADRSGKLEIFDKNARQNPELAGEMATALTSDATGFVGSDPVTALEIWLSLYKAGLADEDSSFSPRSVIENEDDIVALVTRIGNRSIREHLYVELQANREDWMPTYSRLLLSEGDPVLAGLLAGAIHEADPDALKADIDRVLSRPGDHAGAFVWLAQRANEDDTLRRARPLRLFKQLLKSTDHHKLSAYRSTLAPLLESGGTLPKLVADLDEEQAAAAMAEIERSALEDYLKESLGTALELRFASLRTKTDHTLYALDSSIDARREEIRHLKETEIPENRTAIQEAVALGDLRENFEYKSARQRHEYLSARLATLMADLERARPIELENVMTDEVRIGTSVSLADSKGNERELVLVGPWESDPDRGLLSYESDLGKTLLGSKPGETVSVGEDPYEITEIRQWEGPPDTPPPADQASN